MRTSWIAPLAALVVAFAPLAQAQTKNGKTADTGFVQQALKSGQEEVALAKMAAEKSQNGELKQLAQMLVSDHTQVNEQLQLLAQRNGAAPAPRDGSKRSGTDTTAPPATSPGAAPSSAKAAELAKLSGSEFDKKFLAMIIEGHEKSVELYSTEAEKGANPAAKKLATETLPKIKQHLQQAKSLQQQTMDKKAQ
jgi:putative membrane protein